MPPADAASAAGAPAKDAATTQPLPLERYAALEQRIHIPLAFLDFGGRLTGFFAAPYSSARAFARCSLSLWFPSCRSSTPSRASAPASAASL